MKLFFNKIMSKNPLKNVKLKIKNCQKVMDKGLESILVLSVSRAVYGQFALLFFLVNVLDIHQAKHAVKSKRCKNY